MTNHRLAEAAVRSRHTVHDTQQHASSAPATPADLIYGQPGRLTSKTRYMLALHPLPAQRPIVVLDEMANVEPFEALMHQAGGNVVRLAEQPARRINPLQVTVTHTQRDVVDAVLDSFGVKR